MTWRELVSHSQQIGSSSLCLVERKHSSPEKVRACSTVSRAIQGFQSVDLASGLTIAPLRFDRIPDSINVPV
jgi:hypothetical protein